MLALTAILRTSEILDRHVELASLKFARSQPIVRGYLYGDSTTTRLPVAVSVDSDHTAISWQMAMSVM